jgi:hypothetical protein
MNFSAEFRNVTPVSGGDNFNMARAQSLLTGNLLGGVCPPLTPNQAADVLRWHRPLPSGLSATEHPYPPVAGEPEPDYASEQYPQDPIRSYADRRGY